MLITGKPFVAEPTMNKPTQAEDQLSQCTNTSLTFTSAQCDTLFENITINDRIDLLATLVADVNFNYSQEQLTACYLLSCQLWRDGVNREALQTLVQNIYKTGTLTDEEQLAFKHMRAKFKQLRFAFVMLDKRHRYPPAFHLLTMVMGKLQDAFKNAQTAKVSRWSLALRFLLSQPIYKFCTRKVNQFKPATVDSLAAKIIGELHFLKQSLASNPTSKTFHEMRKVISRLVALHCSLMALYPSDYHQQLFRYLATLNGLMGNLHDELILNKFDNPAAYYKDSFTIPLEIKQRLQALTDSYDAALARTTGAQVQ